MTDNKTNYVAELKVLEEDCNLFDTEMNYIIPLYQRAYAWGDKQLIQLIEDISDISGDTNYYIGALVVSKQDNGYEVVDGQQRLTSLYLLMSCLGLKVKNTLRFACREKSNNTLEKIEYLLQDDRSKFDMNSIESGINNGIKILTELISKADFDKNSFLEKLRKVVIYRIEVPENTDLNRYFEIMNTRGEQLEQHDILKATLMRSLPDSEKNAFAKIWDACSDMTGYVQMHFVSKDNEVREKLFGSSWDNMPSDEWNTLVKCINTESETGSPHKITDIIDIDFKVNKDDGYLDNDVRVRFESIIEFPYFLLHTLKVLIYNRNIKHEDGTSEIVAEQLDDKKLIDCFKQVIDHGVVDTKRISDDKSQFTRDFITCLLRTRYLFDKYIVKREYANDNSDGEWSIKSLHVSGQKSAKKPYYRNTKFTQSGKWDSTNNLRCDENIMLQSALRVSYTSPKVMHWITKLLLWLSEDGYKHTCEKDIVEEFCNETEKIAKAAVCMNFFDECKDGSFAMGVNTPHIVFNYLDFLIWKSNRKKYDDFTFEFRNSVEHWYPQNPSEGSFDRWKDGLDHFGNLCIVQRKINSRFSNMSPEAKKTTFIKMISKGSLKLRIMSELTEEHGDKKASSYWKETAYKEHEKAMIAILSTACGVSTSAVFPDESK